MMISRVAHASSAYLKFIYYILHALLSKQKEHSQIIHRLKVRLRERRWRSLRSRAEGSRVRYVHETK